MGISPKYISLSVLVLQNSMLALTMRYSRTISGPMYMASTAVVLCEIIKLVISVYLLRLEELASSKPSRGVWTSICSKLFAEPLDLVRLMIPAALYTVQNNLAYFAVSRLDAAAYQLLYQLKILTTALFSVFLLRRSLTRWQWIALGMLVVGVGLVQTSNLDKKTDDEEASKNSVEGFFAVIAACMSSGLAGVYFEMVLKAKSTSLWVRNVQMSLTGVALGWLPVWRDRTLIAECGSFLCGYNQIVWMVIFLQAAGGILVALVVKYADNILKGFATSLSIVISCVCSYFLFNFVVNLRFIAGAVLVLYAVFLYSSSVAKPAKIGTEHVSVKDKPKDALEKQVNRKQATTHTSI